MTFSGIMNHFEIPIKYPALNRTKVTTTIDLKADSKCSKSNSLQDCLVDPSISSIQTSIGIPKDLMYTATASVSEL